MNAIDFSPLFRTAIGFDRLARLMDTARSGADAGGYPPYNIEKTSDDSYVLTMAVAGFAETDLDITAHQNTLTVVGRAQAAPDETRRFLHRGIAGRGFERDHIVVSGAKLENGLLHIALRHEVPEALKPRQIPVQSTRPAALPEAA
jgi:molecular chaperone IbpA